MQSWLDELLFDQIYKPIHAILSFTVLGLEPGKILLVFISIAWHSLAPACFDNSSYKNVCSKIVKSYPTEGSLASKLGRILPAVYW